MHAPLPVHPSTGARALGWRKARPGEDDGELYPIWPILGAADDDDDDGGQDDDTDSGDDDQDDDSDGDQDDADGDDGGDQDDDADDDDGADQLGDKGKKALDRMKEKLKAERTRRRQAEQQLAQGKNKDGGPDGDDVRRQAEQAATAKANARILRSEVRAAAKGRLADPRDALTFLDLEQFEVDDNGQVDEDEINDAIDDLLKSKPYLAAQGGRRFQGTADGGATRKAGQPKQLTERDLKNMTPEEIDKAAEEGRLDDLLKG